jgi:cytochrome c biogenesis protein CcmG, thiol:disulfide interchange protein DsbE
MTMVDEPTTPDPEPEDDDALDAPQRGRTALVISVVIAVVLALFVFVLATRKPATDRVTDSPLVGKPAPALTGGTLDGDDFDINGHVGQWVVVNFFATWCTPCRHEHPQLDSFDQTHSRIGDAALVSVVFDDDTDEVRDFFDQAGGNWPVVSDGTNQIITDWGVSGVPETYLVAPSGRVVAKVTGGVTQAGLEDIMAEWDAQFSGSPSGSGSGS